MSEEASPLLRVPCTGLVLAGGEGRRMGGADKGWLMWQGKPLILHAVETLAPQVDRVIISANRNQDRYRRLGCPVVGDSRPGFNGPLAGMEAAMGIVPAGWVLCVPCDVPGFPASLRQRLEAGVSAGAPAAMAFADGRGQPLFSLLHTRLLSSLAAYLDRGERRAQDWLVQIGAVTVAFGDNEGSFSNLNRPQHLASAD